MYPLEAVQLVQIHKHLQYHGNFQFLIVNSPLVKFFDILGK